ncbi:MAG: hypothetical protein V4568_04920 [Pseudomonadota bacterium]
MANRLDVNQPGKKRRYWYLIPLLLIVWPASCAMLPLKYSAEPIEAWVVDKETNQPIEGTVVVARWILEGGLHVDQVGSLEILEAISDKQGRIYFSGWGPKWHWGAGRLTYKDPELLVFKSGYRVEALVNEASPEALGGKYWEIRKSDWNGKIVKMEKFKGDQKDYVTHLGGLDTSLGFASRGGSCAWEKIPQMIGALYGQRKQFDAAGIRGFSSIDDHLNSNENYYLSKGCHSPKAFLREHLQ